MFTPEDILYEDNHLLIVNKRCGDLVQPDPSGESALEDQIKAFVKRRDAKPGDVFLGVVHRLSLIHIYMCIRDRAGPHRRRADVYHGQI